ncbi:MAG TPA: hypothetical protein VGX50_12305, partial [Longimicrobium sp.]|nr:hypothetical protein [Longimicrobium sp.]
LNMSPLWNRVPPAVVGWGFEVIAAGGRSSAGPIVTSFDCALKAGREVHCRGVNPVWGQLGGADGWSTFAPIAPPRTP